MHCNEIKYAVVFDSVRLYTYKTGNPERPARDCELHYNPSGFAYEFLPTVNYIYGNYEAQDIHTRMCILLNVSA